MGPRTGDLRFLLLLVLGMDISSTVARFAGHAAMISLFLGRGNLTVTVGAGFTARVFQGQLGILHDGSGSVVSPQTKAGGDKKVSDDKIDNKKSHNWYDDVAYLFRYPFPHRPNPLRAGKLIQMMRNVNRQKSHTLGFPWRSLFGLDFRCNLRVL